MENKKEIKIEVDENIISDLADILCFFSGYKEAKGDSWGNDWINDSFQALRNLRIEIEDKLSEIKSNKNN